MQLKMQHPVPVVDGGISKKPRASKPKVKSGCRTCKARRVKCDETKPACLRCSNFGRQCGGYPSQEDTPPPKETSPPVQRRLLAKGLSEGPSSFGQPLSQTHLTSFTTPLQIALPPGVSFQDDREYQYFCHFRDITAISLSGGFDPFLWTSVVLKACKNPYIRDLTTATAALSIAYEQPLNRRDQIADSHHQYALQKYGTALQGLGLMASTANVAGQDCPIRIACVSSLLVFCFENIHGSIGRGVLQIQSTLDMIVKQISEMPLLYYFLRVAAPTTQQDSLIDYDLLTAFMRLDGPALAIMSRLKGYPPKPASRVFTQIFSGEELQIPSSFTTITDARVYLDDIKWRTLPVDQPPESVFAQFDRSTEDDVSPTMDSVPFQLRDWFQSADIAGRSSNLGFRLSQWHDAFAPLLNFSLTPAGAIILIPAVTLHIQALSTDLLLNGFSTPSCSQARSSSFSTRHTSYTDLQSPSLSFPETRVASCEAISAAKLEVPMRSHGRSHAGSISSQGSSPAQSPDQRPEFMTPFPTVNAILNFSRRLIAHPNFSRGFVFDIGIIPALTRITTMCPDRGLRLEAIAVLRSMDTRREAMWDAKICADAGDKHLIKEDIQDGFDLIDPLLL